MNKIPLNIKRIVAYIIQVIVVLIIYTGLSLFFSLVLQNFVVNTAPNILKFFNSNNLMFNVNEEAFIDASKIFDKTSFLILYQEFIMLLLVYCFFLFVIVPFMTRVVVSFVGDIGKKIMGLYIVSHGRVVKNNIGMKTSPAIRTFRLYYGIILFFQLSLPMYYILLNVPTPRLLTILIFLAFVLGLGQLLISFLILFKYFIGFLTKKYFWRQKVGVEVVDDLDAYVKAYDQKMKFYEQEKLSKKQEMEDKMLEMREIEFENRNNQQTNQQEQNENTKINNQIPTQKEKQFPIFYEFMINNGYTQEQYDMLEMKGKTNQELEKILNFIEMKQRNDARYIFQNIAQIKRILNIV